MKSESIFNTKSEKKNKSLVKILEYLMINGYSFPHEITKSMEKSKQSISRELRYLEKKKLIRWRNWIEFPNERVPVEITFKGILLLSNEKSFNIKYIVTNKNFNSIFNAKFTDSQTMFLKHCLKNKGITSVLQIFVTIIKEQNLWDNELLNEFLGNTFDFKRKDLVKWIDMKNENPPKEENQMINELLTLYGMQISSLNWSDVVNIEKAQESLIETLSKDEGKKINKLVFSDFIIPLYTGFVDTFDEIAERFEQKLIELKKVEKSLEQRIKQKSSNV